MLALVGLDRLFFFFLEASFAEEDASFAVLFCCETSPAFRLKRGALLSLLVLRTERWLTPSRSSPTPSVSAGIIASVFYDLAEQAKVCPAEGYSCTRADGRHLSSRAIAYVAFYTLKCTEKERAKFYRAKVEESRRHDGVSAAAGRWRKFNYKTGARALARSRDL